jgi:hypothetical protein
MVQVWIWGSRKRITPEYNYGSKSSSRYVTLYFIEHRITDRQNADLRVSEFRQLTYSNLTGAFVWWRGLGPLCIPTHFLTRCKISLNFGIQLIVFVVYREKGILSTY